MNLKMRLDIFIPSADLLNQMKNYQHRYEASVTEGRFYDSNAVCSHILSLRKPTFIQSLESIVEARKDAVAIVSLAKDSIIQAESARFSTISSSGSSLLTVGTSPLASNWRYLQAIASNADPFSSDSQVYLSA